MTAASPATPTLDHLVYATPDLSGTTDLVGRQLGVMPAAGGRHVGRGTANTLVRLGDGAYLEIVGPDPTQPDPPQPRPFGVDELSAPRLVTFAVRVPSMDAALARASGAGYDAGEAASMERATPDGGLLAWSLTASPQWAGGVVPFLIDWARSTHPSQTIAASAVLRSFRLASPEDGRVRDALAAIGVAMTVEHADEPALTAVIDGPCGSITLSSAMPDRHRRPERHRGDER